MSPNCLPRARETYPCGTYLQHYVEREIHHENLAISLILRKSAELPADARTIIDTTFSITFDKPRPVRAGSWTHPTNDSFPGIASPIKITALIKLITLEVSSIDQPLMNQPFVIRHKSNLHDREEQFGGRYYGTSLPTASEIWWEKLKLHFTIFLE